MELREDKMQFAKGICKCQEAGFWLPFVFLFWPFFFWLGNVHWAKHNTRNQILSPKQNAAE